MKIEDNGWAYLEKRGFKRFQHLYTLFIKVLIQHNPSHPIFRIWFNRTDIPLSIVESIMFGLTGEQVSIELVHYGHRRLVIYRSKTHNYGLSTRYFEGTLKTEYTFTRNFSLSGITSRENHQVSTTQIKVTNFLSFQDTVF